MLVEAAIAVLVAGGGILPFLLRLARRGQVDETLPPQLRKEIAQDLPTIVQILANPTDATILADHIHAGIGQRPVLHVDITDAGPQTYYELAGTTTVGATSDAALRKLSLKVAAMLNTDEAPVDPDLKALAADTTVTSPVADQPGGDVA